MVGLKRNSNGPRSSGKSRAVAALGSVPPAGYKTPPTLIGWKTIKPSILALRAKNYAAAYKICTLQQWNTYVSFGIQEFESLHAYFTQCEQDSEDEKNLRLARYYRLHLETHTTLDAFLLGSIPAVEDALKDSHPSFFEMSLVDMDMYRAALTTKTIDNGSSTSSLQTAAKQPGITNLTSASATQAVQSVPSPAAENMEIDQPASVPTSDNKTSTPVEVNEPASEMSTVLISSTQENASTTSNDREADVPKESESELDQTFTPVSPTRKAKKKRITTSVDDTAPTVDTSQSVAPSTHRPSQINHTLRIEARWAPKDFNELRASTATMYLRLAPILSCFNNEHTWLLEWLTDQMPAEADILCTQLAKYLSIRVVPVAKEKCFYFSFRIAGKGSQFTQVMQSKILKAAESGESLRFNPSSIPPHQGELIFVGDILLKDASVTHRGHYLQYLRREVLPSDTPVFDLKVRYTPDQRGHKKIPILTVRCGKAVSTKVAELLSEALCGSDENPEIFISRLALGANQTTKQDHKRIYDVHHAYLSDVAHIVFPTQHHIDKDLTEHLDEGGAKVRSPRQWAKSLKSASGASLEADLEDGTRDGQAVLIVPAASLAQATVEVQKYCQSHNPALSTAAKMYSDSMAVDPDIPMNVFAKNIDTILAKKFKSPSAKSDDQSTAFTPVSSITGATGVISRGSNNSIAWNKPLQQTLKYQSQASKPATSIEIDQQKRIAILEAQLALTSKVTAPSIGSASTRTSKSAKSKKTRSSQSKQSKASTQSSGNSPLTAASTQSRIEGLEAAMINIQLILEKLTADKAVHSPLPAHAPPASPVSESASASVIMDPLWPTIAESLPNAQGMTGVQLFPPESTELTILNSPRKSPKLKRLRESPKSPPKSTLRLQYNEPTGAGGGDEC